MNQLSTHQASLLHELLRLNGVEVRWCGIDAGDLPVLQVKDANGVGEPFAVRSFMYRDATTDPAQPVREEFTDDELDSISSHDIELICRLRREPFE